jgi:anti-sigma regulatory factor (Ser/Thr protein kinase)
MDAPSQHQWFRSQPEAEKEQVTALLEVSRSVHEGGDLRTTLDTIAEAATRVVGATSASVLMVETEKSLRLAGSHGLTPEYEGFLSSRFIVEGGGQAGWALQVGRTVTIADMDNHPYTRRAYAKAWRRFAAIQGYRSMAASPLTFRDETLGVLNVYRAHVGEWPERMVDLLTAFAQHAAVAIATAQLLDVRARHVAALTRVVGALREQTHEYANRVHAVHGLLALGEYESAQEFVDELTASHHRTYSETVDSIGDPILAALVLAEMNLARQRGIELSLHATSSLSALPGRLTAADAVTVVGNLLDNAIDAVDRMPRDRRRVELRLAEDEEALTITVRDYGAGLPVTAMDRLFTRGFSSKNAHAGVGLTLAAAAVTAARGAIDVRRHVQGTTFEVTIPRS